MNEIQRRALKRLLDAARAKQQTPTLDSGVQNQCAMGTLGDSARESQMPLLARLQMRQTHQIRQLAELADVIELVTLDPSVELGLLALGEFQYT